MRLIDEHALVIAGKGTVIDGELYIKVDDLNKCLDEAEVIQPTLYGWIPCGERLPENIQTVLVSMKGLSFTALAWYGNETWYMDDKELDEEGLASSIIAWQPLPPAYKESEEE